MLQCPVVKECIVCGVREKKRITCIGMQTCGRIKQIKKKILRALSPLTCFEGESQPGGTYQRLFYCYIALVFLCSLSFLYLLVRISSTGSFSATSCMRLFLCSRFSVFWCELLRQAHWQNNTHTFPRIGVLRSWGAPIPLACHQVHVSRSVHCSNFCSTSGNVRRKRGW